MQYTVLKTVSQTAGRLLLSLCLGLLFFLGSGHFPVHAQSLPFPPCEGIAFSTEEDFMTRGPVPIDGNPIISDGDLLSRKLSGGVTLCARNHDLLQTFNVRVDLGLDAADVILPGKFAIAFSTDLDDPNRQFTAGDLLATNGAILPNRALLVRFDLPIPEQDLGLDAIQFKGDPDRILRFLDQVRERGRDFWLERPDVFIELLEEFDLDILFSTEGTGFAPEKPSFLDGDLLSARSGTIVIPNRDLLPMLPAGLPDRGADYGLDAFTFGRDPIEQIDLDLFSTEIVSLERRLAFTDGDVLQIGGVFLKNLGLIQGLEPVTKDLGLDALDSLPEETPLACLPRITTVGGFDLGLIDPLTGYARQQDSASAPLPPPPAPLPFDSPFGRWISIRGQVPDAQCLDISQYEYRLEYDAPDTPLGSWTSIITPTGWQFNQSFFCPIPAWAPYQSDSDGWIPLATYWQAKNTCRPDQVLNEWRTHGLNGLYRLRLTVRENGNPASAVMSAEVPVMLDNTAPNRVEMTLYDATGTEPLANQCEVTGADAPTVITIKGQVRDDGQGSPSDGDEHFRSYWLSWTGGDVHSFVGISVPRSDRYYDGGRPDIDGGGTLPPAATDVPLATFNFSDAYQAITGEEPIKCGYTIRLIGADRTIIGGFKPSENLVQDFTRLGFRRGYNQSFCFTPLKE